MAPVSTVLIRLTPPKETEMKPRLLNAASTMDKRLLRSYLLRKAAEQQGVIDNARVFSKRYGDAVDELEEIEELLQVNAS